MAVSFLSLMFIERGSVRFRDIMLLNMGMMADGVKTMANDFANVTI